MEIPTNLRDLILVGLRSPAPMFQRIQHMIAKGWLRPTIKCLPKG